ncbi:LytR/AlgR family response regulator transcription factor [Mucilaginibacter flavus]|uniref:LytR/AlgR family response regulator transcription factor n=1 Tax=Mucilaginibacter flavus TaxID=931504 RepID=UPI0025B3A5A3|nr:LytTR family DNA-binding domain-containing protein [Mucilaginibacter flavus]MDN3580925.1 LytTR family DNA-binding domain-containing protein [Mucilaginibacter flavus]
MNIYKCIIIDDDPFAIEWLEKYISFVPNLRLIKSYTNPMEALVDLSNGEMMDLILLDIEMPVVSGIELSQEIRQRARKIVFSTAYKEYGYQAFEVNADAYLLKPYTLSKFAGTIEKLFSKENHSVTKNNDDFFFVKDKYESLKLIKINYREIIAAESKQNYVLIHTLSKKVLTYMSLTEISKILNEKKNFVQFQRSFIIGKDHIESIDGNTIKMVNELRISVGDYYKKDFTSFLSEKLIKAGRKGNALP